MASPKPTIPAINRWLEALGLGTVDRLEPVAGGCICDNYHLVNQRGDDYFLKTCSNPPVGFFTAEARGLQALAKAAQLRIPQVIASEESFLLLEYVAPGKPGRCYWEQLGEGLALIHRQQAPCFGFEQDNFCGTSPQLNPRTDDGYRFFGESRLRHQGRMALHRGLLNRDECDQLDTFIDRLPELVPPMAPSLLHGDLWAGNVYCDSAGDPVLIDPACYWGWREADIAMTQLFGALPDPFYRVYQQCLPMADDWEQRMPVYNLYHLLNHLNLFGSSYRSSVLRILADWR